MDSKSTTSSTLRQRIGRKSYPKRDILKCFNLCITEEDVYNYSLKTYDGHLIGYFGRDRWGLTQALVGMLTRFSLDYISRSCQNEDDLQERLESLCQLLTSGWPSVIMDCSDPFRQKKVLLRFKNRILILSDEDNICVMDKTNERVGKKGASNTAWYYPTSIPGLILALTDMGYRNSVKGKNTVEICHKIMDHINRLSTEKAGELTVALPD